jgi:hypothetical protein
LLSEEEIKIRQDPTARVTDLLKEVFGSNWRGREKGDTFAIKVLLC